MCKIPDQILKLMEDSKPDAKRAAFAWFNKCDLDEIQKEKIVLVECERVESFIEYANKKGVHPSGGALSQDFKSQYLYL